ncbi:MAG: SH3 domain-containing protein [Butyrivibrio sp.]|nr:SH3 domain-containing protein [Butyrivibrio sp.]
MTIAGYGIDVSHHQGKIDWPKVARSGITSAGNLPVNFSILKCIYESQSHRPDERFEENYRGCIDNAINVGIYVYHASASLNDPVAEAEALVRTLNERKLHLGIWHDLEDKSLRAAGNLAIHKMLKIEDEILKSHGYTDIGIYCSKYWHDSVLDKKYLKGIYKYWWIARYLKDDLGQIPPESMSPAKYADAWQFSSKGKVSGIAGNVDLDVDFTGLAAAMAKDLPKSEDGFTPSKQGIKTVKVTNKLNIRLSPELGDNIIGQIPNGAKVNVTETSGKWSKIEGWVSTNYLE